MAVIMISTQRVKDWDLLAEYRKGAGPIVRRHGGELLGRDGCAGEFADGAVGERGLQYRCALQRGVLRIHKGSCVVFQTA